MLSLVGFVLLRIEFKSHDLQICKLHTRVNSKP
jgi:hypothetical protein